MANYDLSFPGAAIDAILTTAYDLQNAGYIFKGSAYDYTGTPTERTWLIAGEGFTGFGFTTAVPKGCIGLCLYNGSTWSGKVVRVVTIDVAPTSGSTNAVQSGAVYSMVNTVATGISDALNSLTFQETTVSGDEGLKLVESLKMTSQGVTDILTSFTILAATTSKAGLLSASDKAKLDAILTNIRSMVVTDTTLTPNQGTELTESLKWTVGGVQEVISAFTILAATTSKAGLMSASDKAKLNTLFADGYKFAGIAVPSSTPMSTTAKIFYFATQAGTYTLFGDITLTDGINVLMYSGSAWSGLQIVGIDSTPTSGSKSLVESGGVNAVFDNVYENIGGENFNDKNKWEQGAISSETGENNTTLRNYRIRTKEIAYTHNDRKVTLPQGMSVYVFLYASDGTFINSNGWLESATIIAGSYYRLVLAKDTASTSPSTTITVDDLQYVNIGVIALYECGSKVYDAVLDFNVTLDSQKVISWYISSSDLEWHQTSSTYKGKGVIVDVRRFKGQVVRMVNPDNDFYYAALIDNSHAVDTQPSFANAEKRKPVSANTIEEITISDNVNYLFIPTQNSNGDANYPTVTIFGKVNYQNRQVLQHNEDIQDIKTSVFDTEILESELSLTNHVINASTKKWITHGTARGAFIDVSKYHGRSVSFENHNEGKAYFAELADNTDTAGTTPSYTTLDQRKYVNPDEKVIVKIAPETNYIYVSVTSTSGDDIYPNVTILSKIIAETVSMDNIPQIYKNVQKKAAQLQYLDWYAKGPISNYITEGEHVGMLYSSCVEVDRYVNYDISLKTFMTAANNPYSLLYTENLEQGNHRSGYGFTYYTNRNTGRAYMGTVCSRLTGYASGMPIEYDTAFFSWLCKEGVYTRIDDQTAQGVEIGDLTWISGHVRIVTDVTKNEGRVVSIVVTEAWIPLCRALTLTPAQFDAYITNNHGIIYRYNKLAFNTVYQPSQFVSVDEEPSPADYNYNNDICTYAGDYAPFYEGFPIWLNYNLEEVGDWTAIELYKESWSRANVLSTELVGTFEIDPTEHKIRLDTDESPLEHGLYRARMTDGTNYSDYTYFEVIEVNESVSIPNENNPDIKRVDFSSSNGTPVRVVFCDIDGTPRAIKNLTQDDRMNGYVLMNPNALCQVQRNETLPSTIYLRVYMMGKYGRVSRQISV